MATPGYEQLVEAWQVPDLDPVRYEQPLRALHVRLLAGAPLEVTCHRFLLTARRAP